MASSSVCWGIEIGAAAIKAVKLEAVGEGGARLLEYAHIAHPKPLSTPDVNPNDILRVSLGALASQYDLSKASIAVSVPGHAAFARFAKLPPVEPKKVPDIVKFEAMQQIPFGLDQVEWDYQTFVTPDAPDIEVGIFAITREKVMERVQMLEDLGIVPNYVVLSPIAVYNALAYDLEFDNKTPGTILVDVGTTSTDLVIATPGRMWIRTFPIGGHQFTEALVSQFQLSYPKAEKLKREAEDSKHARQVFQAMRPVFTNLAQDIQRSIGYYQSLNRDANLTRLIGIGSTFRLPGLRKYLKQQLSLDVYRVEEFKKISVDGENSAKFNEESLNLVTAYGLALQGLGLNSVGGNLMPVSVLRKSMWKEKVPYFGIAAGAALAASAAMFLIPLRDSAIAAERGAPPSLRQVVEKHTSLKREAEEAGVLAAGEPDTKAANLAGLMDKRGIYQYIVRDVQSMFEAANGRAPTWATSLGSSKPVGGAAYALQSMTCDYIAPTVTDPAMAGMGDPSVSGSPDDPLNITAYPHIQVSLTMNTSQPEPRRFAQETIERWLESNKIRKDIPYEIVFAPRPVTVAEIGSDPNASSQVASSTSSPGFPDDMTKERMGRRGGGTLPGGLVITADGQMGTGPASGKHIRPVELPAGGSPFRGSTPGMSSGGNPQMNEQKTAAATSVEQLAPFDEAAMKPATALTGEVRVSWYVVFKPPAPSTDPANPAPEAGAGGNP